MADNDTGGSAGTEPIDMTTITLDGQEVSVPATAAEILKQKEHSIQSGYDKKLAEERATMQAESGKTGELLQEDLAELNRIIAINPDAIQYYEPKVSGGRGYVGSQDLLQGKSDNPAKTTPANPDVFNNNADMLKMKKDMAALEGRLNSLNETGDNTVDSASTTFRQMLTKYPYCDNAALSAKLDLFHIQNGRHPSDKFIEVEAKKLHDFVTGKLSKAAPKDNVVGSTTATPTTGGSNPSPSPKKVPNLENAEEFSQYVADNWASIAQQG